MLFSVDTKRKICVCKTSIYSLDLLFQFQETHTNEISVEGGRASLYTSEPERGHAQEGPWSITFPREG